MGASSQRARIFRRLLGLFDAGKLVDLGTGHGNFARMAADLGWDVTAVDARADRWPEDDRVTWIRSDLRDHDLAPYDLIASLGVFYHLTCQDQIDFLTRAAGTPLIIDTHLDHGTHEHRLSPRVTILGYEGRSYREGDQATSSWGNEESFWPTLDSFLGMLADAGYQTILAVEPWLFGDRTFFLALGEDGD